MTRPAQPLVPLCDNSVKATAWGPLVLDSRGRLSAADTPLASALHSIQFRRFLPERVHRVDIRNGSVADARNPEFSEALVVWYPVHHHHINRQRGALTDPGDQRLLLQPRDEKARCPGRLVGAGSVQRSLDRGLWIIALPEKQIRACVDEQRDLLLVGGLPDRGDATGLPINAVQSGPLDDAIFEIDSNDTQIQQVADVLG